MRTSSSNQMTVVFYSDGSYVDRGFSANFIAFNPIDRKCWVLDSTMNSWYDYIYAIASIAKSTTTGISI